MKKDEFIALGISAELAEKAEAKSLEELKGYIPKARFDEVNAAKKQLETSMAERDKQLEDLKKTSGDAEALRSQIAKLQEDNKAKDEAHAAEIRQLKIDTAVEAALTGAKAKNVKAVIPFLDLKDAVLTEDGTVKGLDKQIEKLAKDEGTAFLFEAKDTSASGFRGFKQGQSGDAGASGMTLEAFRKLSPADRYAFSQDHPDEYKSMYGGT